MRDKFDFDLLPDPSDYTPAPSSHVPARGRVTLPASPVVTGFIAAAALALAVLLFLVALPGEDKTLVYRGEEVQATDMCRSTAADGEPVDRMCLEVAETQVTETGWGIVQLVISLVLAAGAAFLIYAIPKQAKEREGRTRDRIGKMAERDYKRT
jgi:hypothetical protein